MKRALLALPALLVLAASSAMAAETKVELFRNRLFLPVTVNGTRITALLDSAAEMSVIDDTLARRLRLRLGGDQAVNGSGGADKGRFAHGLSLAAAGIRLRHMTAVVLDLRDLSQRLVGRPVSLILGREIFDSARLRVDFSRGTLAAVPRTATPPGERYTLVTARGVETFPASIEGLPPVRAEFRPGQRQRGAGRQGLCGAERPLDPGADRRPQRRRRHRRQGQPRHVILQSLTVGGRTFDNVRAAIDDATGNAADLNVGTSILRRFLITTDFPQHALWLEPRT